jgi:hypothetical protein
MPRTASIAHPVRPRAGRAIATALVLVLLALPSALDAQVTTVFRTRPFLSGARALAFADAYVSDVHDVNSMYWNPAALVYLQNTSVVLNHTLDRSSNIMNENVASPVYLRKGELASAGFSVNHIGHLGKSATGDFKAVQYGADGAYAREIVPTFSVGGSANLRHASASGGSAWALTGSIGAFYTPAEGICYGAVLSGLGSGVRYTYDGVSTLLSTERLSRILQVGATLHFPAPAHKTQLTLAIANEKVFGQTGLRYKGGAEYVILRLVALRLGYIVDPDVRVATYGVGLHAGRWQVDFGMLPSRLTDRLYQFTIAFDLWPKPEGIRTER